MHNHRLLPTISLLLGATLAAQNPFGRGNLVVLRIGDGTAALSNAAQAVFLDEYTTTGALVQSLALPIAPAGSNQAMTNSGTATAEGNLQLSADGQWLVLAGYGAAPGTPAVASTQSLQVPRVIARVSMQGAIDTSTALQAFTGVGIRSATTDTGGQFWTVGAAGGVQWTTLGATTTTALNAGVPLTCRIVSIQAGQLYVDCATSTFQGVSTVGYGLPSAAGQTVTLLPGFPTASGPSPYDFFFADMDTLYVADDHVGAPGGIQKWTQSGGTWTLQYTLTPPNLSGSAFVGCRGLAGVVNGGVATLYATTTEVGANQIVAVTDTGAAATFTTLAQAGANTVARGIRVLTGGSILRLAHGCGPTTIALGGQPVVGGAVSTLLGATVGAPLVGYGFVSVPTPFCSCTIGHSWTGSVFGGSSTLQVPNNPTFRGVVLGIQGIDLFGVGGCAAPQFTATDTMVVTIG